jgi:hypothetical protein
VETDLDVDLVSAKNDGDVLANTLEVTVPVGNVLVGDTGSNIEHDDTALALDVVTIAETTELLLTGGVPDVEADGAEVGGECEGVDLDTESGWGRRKGLVDLDGLVPESLDASGCHRAVF